MIYEYVSVFFLFWYFPWNDSYFCGDKLLYFSNNLAHLNPASFLQSTAGSL